MITVAWVSQHVPIITFVTSWHRALPFTTYLWLWRRLFAFEHLISPTRPVGYQQDSTLKRMKPSWKWPPAGLRRLWSLRKCRRRYWSGRGPGKGGKLHLCSPEVIGSDIFLDIESGTIRRTLVLCSLCCRTLAVLTLVLESQGALCHAIRPICWQPRCHLVNILS